MLRVCLALLLFLLSLLVVCKAPNNFFWRVTVAITEFPYLFIAASLLLLIISFYADRYKPALLLLSAASIVLYTLPVIKAYQRGSSLPAELAAVFPSSVQGLAQPFSFLSMFSGIVAGEVKPESILYKKVPGRDLYFDFYPAGKKAPCVIVIHGGSWAEGDSKQLPDLNSYLANRGYHVAAINYRLAPAFQCPAPVEDTREVMNYLVTHAAEWQVDTANFILLGRSAGGQIALLDAYTANDPKIKGVISFYAPADMVWGARIKGNRWVLDTDKVLSDYIGGSIDHCPDKYTASSPVEFVSSHSTPTLLIHGENDCMVSFLHSTRLKEKLDANHVRNYLLNLPVATHGCDFNINGPSGQLSTFAIERFIQSVVN